ncbi:[Fe-Fe] hydrogenase large subunit C-terminal domain-containing protein [Halanaerobium hydrogeniformans]|uniref:Fe-S cluster domain protein n=1 Tax=Halanaerobium hydrogeniformans TaxID=656519 RepID=E4RJ67_HALHG|nr:[Fe-Fe] hydrogenase large subunit C-terminal domain-containing protein [Halanaerobium hydrogeniformans]ADQ15287.1 Fe-S cluster domain protein [Halanaerobium hydrogeniformans]
MTKKHSVLLKEEKCEGCTNCVKGCPTKAIRVHQGKARIKEDLCVDCAECIRVCEYHAKYSKSDQLDEIINHDYPVLLIPPSFYSQFSADISSDKIKAALYKLGFKKVYDVADAAAALSRRSLEFINQNSNNYVSSSCPAIVRLIKLQYPDLIEMILPMKSPVELIAEKVKKELINEKDIKAKVFFLTPCPAKLTTVNRAIGQEKSFLDGAIAVDKIYQEIHSLLGEINEEDIKKANKLPLSIAWGKHGGEEGILKSWQEINTISVSGIKSVKKLLDEIERNNISEEISYFELTSCANGCLGGILNVINPYQAAFNLESRIKNLKNKLNKNKLDKINKEDQIYNFALSKEIKADNIVKLDKDFKIAMQKLEQMQKEIELLPGLDCAACGAPDCKTFAEDIVNDLAVRTDCTFMLRKRISDLAGDLCELANSLPPLIKGEKEEDYEC